MLSRLSAAAGGAGGLASLLLPYALVTGGTLGLELQEEAYTLFGLAQLLEDAGKDPQMVYALVVVIGVGSALALVGAVASRWLAAIGGVVQAGAAAAFAYGATAKGSRTFLFGLGEMDVTLQVGLFVLAAASVLSLASLPLGLLVRTVRSNPSGA